METELVKLTKEVQKLVGAKEDGAWGPNTAKAVLAAMKETQSPAPDTEETPVHEINQSAFPGVSDDTYRKCIQTINVFETGSKDGDYSNVSIYKDGGGGAYRQITYGRSQATQDGNLDKILSEYLRTAVVHTQAYDVIKAKYPTKGIRAYADDKQLIQALKDAGKEDAMVAAQDKVFDEQYFIPAAKWAETNGFVLPLSLLVIYDSFIHSGSILSFLRKRFSEVPPAKGGDEKAWVKAYVNTRRSWLANHSNKILRNTVYRMDTMQKCISDGNWDLVQPINAHGTIIK